MGTYLTEVQIERAKEELALVYALPYASDLMGTAWEQILADVKGGIWTDMRDNRPRPDFHVPAAGGRVNYSVKTEGLRPSGQRSRAAEYLGYREDFIVARPKVDQLLQAGESIDTLSSDDLGAKVLEYYNEHLVGRYEWHVISFLLRLDLRPARNACEFLYWEERPPAIYDPRDFWWRESGRATGGNRNINGFPMTVQRDASKLPRAKFKWTSGGKQFYVLYTIPRDADVWTVNIVKLGLPEIRNALRELLRTRKRILGLDEAT